MNHSKYDIKDQIRDNQSVFYFQKDYMLILAKNLLYKINLASSAV